MRRARAALGSAAIVVVTCLLGALAFEAALRLTGRPFKGTMAPAEESIAQFDPDTGWSYIPAHSATHHFGDEQLEVSMHFDAAGVRVATATTVLDPKRPTVLLVGGSFIFGHGVRYEDSIAGQLERRIDLQVADVAVQGFGTDQALVQLRRYIDRFDTKAVVYGFVCDHLRRNANEDRHIWLPGSRFPGTKPAFEIAGDGVRQYHWPVRSKNRSYSRLWAYVRLVRAHRGPPPTAALTRALILEMKRESERHGARFVTVDWEIRGTPALCRNDPLADLDVDLIRPARDAPPGWATWFIPGDYHPSPESHAYVADRVAAWWDRSQSQE